MANLLPLNLQKINEFISQRNILASSETTRTELESQTEEIQQITSESAQAITENEWLWHAFCHKLRTSNVVTNASVKHALHDFMTERQERLEYLCKKRLRQSFKREFDDSKVSQSWNEEAHDQIFTSTTNVDDVTQLHKAKSIMPKRNSMIGATATNMTTSLKYDDLWSIPQQPNIPLESSPRRIHSRIRDKIMEEEEEDISDFDDNDDLFVQFPAEPRYSIQDANKPDHALTA